MTFKGVKETAALLASYCNNNKLLVSHVRQYFDIKLATCKDC